MTVATATPDTLADHHVDADSITETYRKYEGNPGALRYRLMGLELAISMIQYATNPDAHGSTAKEYPTLQGVKQIDILSVGDPDPEDMEFTYVLDDGEPQTGSYCHRFGGVIVLA